VNSFGIGGSNAHIVIDSTEQFFEDNPDLRLPRQLTPAAHALAAPRLLLFSANSADSAKNFAQRCIEYSQRNPANVADLAHTLASKREKLSRRSYVLVSASGDMSEPAPALKMPARKQPLVMTFSGQGAQWPQMGRELLLNHPIFAQSIDEMDSILQSLNDAPQWSLKGIFPSTMQSSPKLY
jgi:acyl transferase domain-containing protein